MLVPCWFTLWTSSRFHSSLHPFDFVRNLFIFLFVSFLSFKFLVQFEFGKIMYFFVLTPLVWFAVVDHFFLYVTFLTCSSKLHTEILQSIRAPATLVYKILYGCDTIWRAAERRYYTSLLGELLFEDSRHQYALSIRLEFVWLVTCVLCNRNNGV